MMWITSTTCSEAMLRRNHKQLLSTQTKCDFPIVYNKPPKTASSFLQKVISNWSQQVGRNDYRCSRTPLVTSAVLPECIPQSGDNCGVFNSHVFMTAPTRRLLDQRLPNYRTLTSIRYPPHRIISTFLFTHKLRKDHLRHDNVEVLSLLENYLRSFNPWLLYNYHTGDARTGSCPLSEEQIKDIYSFSSTIDIVIDVNIREESNIILNHFNLFQIPSVNDLSKRPKERGTAQVRLPTTHLELLRNVSCVEMEIHRALQTRMASLYEMATGKVCVVHGVLDILDSCIAQRERGGILNNSWVI